MSVPPIDPRRFRRTFWGIVAFLAGFAALIVVVGNYYLRPAFDAARTADETGRRQLSAVSILLLTILLFTMLAGLAMVFRIGRFFFPRPTATRTTTDHIDAWQESGRRLRVEDDRRG